jgi:hypothetical protein
MAILLFRALIALVVVCPLSATEVNLNAMLGVKLLEHDEWKPVDAQGLLAVQVDVRPDNWPLAIAVNVLGSNDYDRRTVTNVGTVETYGGVTEFQVGLAGLLALPGHTTLYAGGGGTFASALRQTWTASSERSDWGYGVGTWAHAGAFWTIGSFNIGLGGGWSWVPMELDDRDIDAGGWRFGLLLGGHLH